MDVEGKALEASERELAALGYELFDLGTDSGEAPGRRVYACLGFF